MATAKPKKNTGFGQPSGGSGSGFGAEEQERQGTGFGAAPTQNIPQAPAPEPEPQPFSSAAAYGLTQYTRETLPPKMSFGQTVLNGLLSPLANVTGQADANLQNLGKMAQGKLTGYIDPVEAGNKNVDKLWNGKQQPVMWFDDIFEERILPALGIPDYQFTMDTNALKSVPVIGDMLKWGEFEASKAVGAPISYPEKVRAGELSDYLGFTADVAADPFTWVPLRAITTPTKVASKAAIASTKALARSVKGEISLTTAAKRIGKPVEDVVTEVAEMGGKINPRPSNIAKTKQNLRGMGGEADKMLAEATQRVNEEFIYKTVVASNLGLKPTLRGALADAAEAGQKSLAAGILTESTKDFLLGYAKADVKGLFNPKQVVKFKKDADSGKIQLTTGNGVLITEAATMAEAKKLAKEYRTNGPDSIITGGTIENARIEEPSDGGSITVPKEDGTEFTLEVGKIYDEGDGTFTIWDGSDVRQFDSVEKAQSYVDIGASPAAAALEVTTTKQGRNYVVSQGTLTRKFTSKARADEYANSLKTGAAPARAGTPVVSGKLLLDSPAPKVEVEDLLKLKPTETTSVLQSVLKNLDKVAQSVKGLTSSTSRTLKDSLREILDPKRAQLDDFFLRFKPETMKLLERVASNEITPFEALDKMARSGLKQQEQLGKIIESAQLPLGPKGTTIRDAITKTRGNFLKLNDVFGKGGEQVDIALVEFFQKEILDRAKKLQSGKILPGNTPEGLFSQIKYAMGEDIAKQIKATGYLDARNPETVQALRQAVDDLSVKSEAVKYQNYDDLVTGIVRGDDISTSALEKVFKILDPDRRLIDSVEKGAEENAKDFLRRVFTDNGGVATIRDIEKKLALAGDPSYLLKAQGIGYGDIIGGMVRNMIDNGVDPSIAANAKEAAEQFALPKTRATAVEFVIKKWSQYNDQVANALNRALSGNAQKGGVGGLFADIAKLEADPSSVTRISTLGDVAVLNVAKPFDEGSKAILPGQLNQFISLKVKGSLLGTSSYRQGQKAAKLGPEYIGKTAEEKMDTLVEQLELADNMAMALFGTRMIISKNRKDSAFEKAFQQAVTAARETGTNVNFSAMDFKHSVYLHTGDVIQAIRQGGGKDSLAKAFFPDGAVNYDQDVMSWIALDDAARRVLEMHAAGEPLNVTEIAARLLTRSEYQLAPKPAKVKEFEKLAAELADVLTNETTINLLRAAHLQKAAGSALSHIDQAQGFAREIFESLREGWRLNFVEGELSEAARARLVREQFRKFVYASGIMRAQGGEMAETMFRAAAMVFTRNGKLLPETQLSKQVLDNPNAAKLIDLLDFDELYAFRQAQAKWSRYVAPDSVAPAGREGFPKPKPKAKEAAETKYTEAKIAYEKSLRDFDAFPSDVPATEVAKWQRAHLKLQANLDKAREVAWRNWIPTEHFDTQKGMWVASEKYNRDAVLRAAEQDYNRYVAGVQGMEDRAVYLADSAPVVPEHKVLNQKQKAAWLKQFRQQSQTNQVAKAAAINADTAKNVLDEVDAGILDQFTWMTTPEKFYRATQEIYGRSIAEITQMPQVRTLRTKYSGVFQRSPRNRIEFNRAHRPDLDELTPILPGDRLGIRLQEFGERWYGPSGRRDLRQFFNTAESTSITRSARFADAVSGFRERWHKKSPSYLQDFSTVFSAVRNGVELPANSRADLVEMYGELKGITDTLASELGGININGIDGASFRTALARFGLDERHGMSGFESLSPDELAKSLLNDLPFGEVPAGLDTDAAIKWRKRAEKFERTGKDALVALSHAMEAVQMVKFEKGIAEGVASRFSHKALGLSDEQAVKEGFVAVAASSADDTILRFVPEGQLFHPDIADQLGSITREFNNLYNGNRMPAFARGILEVTSFLKATQTILRPGHHITNVVGDTSIAMLFGATKPSHWNPAYRIAARYTSNLQAADYLKDTNHLAKMNELTRMMGDGESTRLMKLYEQGDIGIQDLETQGLNKFFLYQDGKLVPQQILDDDLMTRFEQAGILVQNAATNDIMSLDASFRLLDANEFERTFFDKAVAASRQFQSTVTKVPGDFTAAYSNVNRMATAFRVIQSRGWNSVEDAIRAAADEVNKLHPTVQSLATTERKWGRLLFTYYTWMRVAQAAFIDMAVNHTGALLVIPKLQALAANTQGYRGQSFGVPFEDKNALPTYYSYSVYGPNVTGPQGPRAIRLPFMPLDILDFYAISYDPAQSLYDNILSRDFGGYPLAEGQGQVNLLLKTAAAITPGIQYDFDTGRSSNIDTGAEVFDEVVGNFGFTSLLVGAGLYTPQRYLNPNTTNPLTAEDRKRLLNNFFSGVRSVDYNRQVNLENAKREESSRIRSANKTQVQDFVKRKQNEGMSNDEIYNLLMKLGIEGD